MIASVIMHSAVDNHDIKDEAITKKRENVATNSNIRTGSNGCCTRVAMRSQKQAARKYHGLFFYFIFIFSGNAFPTAYFVLAHIGEI